MNHKDLDVWKEAISFVKEIYKITADFPDSEKYGLVSQLKRAAVSVPTNISEGAARNSDKEFIHFLYISLGSISEVETLIIISNDLTLITESSLTRINNQIEKIRSMILGLIRYLKGKVQK
jgi:four helix bundle protein